MVFLTCERFRLLGHPLFDSSVLVFRLGTMKDFVFKLSVYSDMRKLFNHLFPRTRFAPPGESRRSLRSSSLRLAVRSAGERRDYEVERKSGE